MTEINNIDFKSYLSIMDEINDRFTIINSIFENEIENSDYNYAFCEMCSIQLRIIIELIAMSSYLANQDIVDYNSVKSDWSASSIVKKIKKNNYLYYPIPTNVNSEDLISIRNTHKKIFSERSKVKEHVISTKKTVFDIYDKIQEYCHCGTLHKVINKNRHHNNDLIKNYVRTVYSIISSHVFFNWKEKECFVYYWRK